VLLYVHG